jgi:cytoskeleton protein RodZ
MTDSNLEITEQSENILTIGQQFRNGREKMGLSQDEVARRLFFSKKIITAVENDDYSNIPGITYARGYLRAYAQLVGLSEEAILESFSRMQKKIANKIVAEVTENYSAQRLSKNKKKFVWISYAIVFLLVLLTGNWIISQRNSSNLKISQPVDVSNTLPEEPKISEISSLDTSQKAAPIIDTPKEVDSSVAKARNNTNAKKKSLMRETPSQISESTAEKDHTSIVYRPVTN